LLGARKVEEEVSLNETLGLFMEESDVLILVSIEVAEPKCVHVLLRSIFGNIDAHSPAFDLMNGQQSLRMVNKLKQSSHHLRNHTWFLADPAPKL